ncbi:MAG: C1 family peptidase [Bdellovibrionota bacterium]
MIILSTILLSGQWAASKPTCETLFEDPALASGADFGTLRANFEHSTKYSHELGRAGDIKDQCALGTCHLYSWSSSLEQSYSSRTNSKIALSAKHLTVIHWADTAYRALKSEDPTEKIMLGATASFSRFQVRRAGLVPESVWKPARDFDKPPLSTRLQTYVQNVIDRAKFEMKSTSDTAKKGAILQKAMMDVEIIFHDAVGDLPLKFVYEGKEYTPQTFARTFFPELYKPIVAMRIDGDREAGDVHTKVNDGFLVVMTSVDRAEKTVRDLLDQGKAVYLSYEHEATYVDKATGIMSISAFHFPTNARPLSRRQREWSERSGGGHAVQIVGYDLDPATGKILKFKIKNSWGEGVGDKGYYHMYRDYFRTYATGVTFYQDAGINLAKPVYVVPVQQDFDF